MRKRLNGKAPPINIAKASNPWNVQFGRPIEDSELVANSYYARLKQVRNRVRNEELRRLASPADIYENLESVRLRPLLVAK